MASKISASNPLGILAIDHLEFTCDSADSPTKKLFYTFGFSKSAQREDGKADFYSQGQVRFTLVYDRDETSHTRQYFNKHGEGVSTISFLVENAEHAYNEAIKRGATSISSLKKVESEFGVYTSAIIQGFGDVRNEFIERPKEHFRTNFKVLEKDEQATPLSSRFARIDHLTNNVPKGEMEKWVKFYEDIYGLKVTRYFDIKGAKTGLESKVVQIPSGEIIIPINEPAEHNGKSQIQEFLDIHKGAGVQHIALTTANILDTVGELRERGINFLKVPHTYYEDIPKRDFTVSEDVKDLEARQILVDGDKDGYLLQIFTDTYIGPSFFEVIQRKKHNGFGEGNFQALFDSIERDQIERGYLK